MISFLLTFAAFVVSNGIIIALIAWLLFRHYIHSLQFPVGGISVMLSTIIVIIADIVLIFTKFNFNKIAIILCIIVVFVYFRVSWYKIAVDDLKALEKYSKKKQQESMDKIENLLKNENLNEEDESKNVIKETFGEKADDYAKAIANRLDVMKSDDGFEKE